MKFKSRNPSKDYKFIKHNGLKIFINEDDTTAQTKLIAKTLCNQRGLNYKIFSKIYYLRGDRNKAEYGQVLLGGTRSRQEITKAALGAHPLFKLLEPGRRCLSPDEWRTR